MTHTPESADLAPSRDPTAYARRPLLTGGFWVMMAFCALCLVAAGLVFALGPRLTTTRHLAPALSPLPTVVAPTPPTAAASLAAPPAQDGDLSLRVQRLETNEDKVLAASAAALAAAALSDAAAKPAPFAPELAAAARLLPGSPDALALAALAQQGAPTRAALAEELNELGGEISTGARAPGKDASFLDQALYAVSRVVSIRRLDTRGGGADAMLARAERTADDGDLEGAVAILDRLPESAKASLAPWREKAMRRIEIDRRIAGLRAQAMAQLAAARSGG